MTNQNIQKMKEEAAAAEALLANFSDILGEDADAKLTLVEGETDLFETVSRVLNRVIALNSLIDGLKAHAERVSDRKRRMEKQVDNLRTAIGVALAQAEIDAMETPLGTISRKRLPTKAIVLEEADIPTEYLKTKVEVDKRKLLAALKDGAEVPGATLSNGRRNHTDQNGLKS